MIRIHFILLLMGIYCAFVGTVSWYEEGRWFSLWTSAVGFWSIWVSIERVDPPLGV